MNVEINISDEFITLGDLLKYSGFVMTGGEAKKMIKEGLVKVNDEIEERRGRKVYKGDIVTVETKTIHVY